MASDPSGLWSTLIVGVTQVGENGECGVKIENMMLGRRTEEKA